MEANLAVVGTVLASQQAQQGSFADAIGTDQSDPVAGIQLKAQALEERSFIKPATEAGTAQ